MPPRVAAVASGSSMREGARCCRRQSAATTGSSMATVAALLMKADTRAVASMTSSINLGSLGPPTRSKPRASRVATPLSRSPRLTTKVAAIEIAAWFPKPDSAVRASTVPVTASTTGMAMATRGSATHSVKKRRVAATRVATAIHPWRSIPAGYRAIPGIVLKARLGGGR